jgi:hypothetical protein
MTVVVSVMVATAEPLLRSTSAIRIAASASVIGLTPG